MNEDSLQDNGIIYLSAGFDGPFVLQAFSVRKLLPPAFGLQMCLTDGKVYIGGKYMSADHPQVQDYWLVEITAKFVSQTQPIIIKSIQVVNTYPKKLLGSPPCTLPDYFNKEIGKMGEERLGEPTKRVKYSGNKNSDFAPHLKNSDIKTIAEKQKMPLNSIPHPYSQMKKEDSKPKMSSDKKPNEKRLKITDSEQEGEEDQSGHFTKQKYSLKEEYKISDNESLDESKTCLIKDLYEAKEGWSILCRVNYLNKVECNNGAIAYNFMLSDKNCDEIKCVYFQNRMDGEKDKLEVGKYYIFSHGEVNPQKPANKTGVQKEIQINFDKNAIIIPKYNVDFPLNISKFCRINTICSREANSEVNVVGIIKETKFIDQSTKGKCKYNAIICDPLTGHEIDFLLFLNHNEMPPQRGVIGFLHNYQFFKQNNTCRLNSTYQSYFRPEKLFEDSLTLELKQFRDENDWAKLNFKNLNGIAFLFRTIRELKSILSSANEERIFSYIDCWICDINKKKFYYACKVCKKGTDKKDSGVFYCPHCKKNVGIFHCHTLAVHIADFTSSISVDIIGEHAETLIELKSAEFCEFSHEKQLAHLDDLKYKNVTLKLKTEHKEKNKKESHSVWAVDHSTAINSLKEIHKKLEGRKAIAIKN